MYFESDSTLRTIVLKVKSGLKKHWAFRKQIQNFKPDLTLLKWSSCQFVGLRAKVVVRSYQFVRNLSPYLWWMLGDAENGVCYEVLYHRILYVYVQYADA